MCQSNLLPNIYSHTEQASCCSPKHLASDSQRDKKERKKAHLEGNLKQMHISRKIPLDKLLWCESLSLVMS